jgi:GNAT superfamily N-acetyltransferase
MQPMTTPDTTASFALRPARPADAAAIVGLIGELADFEHLSHLLQVTPDSLAAELFGERPSAECVVAVAGGEGAPTPPAPVIGFALFFTTFSTFLGRRGLWLEDLYVQPAWRGRGVGDALLRHGASLAAERGCGRYEWCVLDWNERAVGFYQDRGAAVMPDWRLCRITGDALSALGRPAPGRT